MPETTVTDHGYTIERRQVITDIKDRRGVIIAFAMDYTRGAWTVHVPPWLADPTLEVRSVMPADFSRFELPDRAQAEQLLELIAQLHAAQQVHA